MTESESISIHGRLLLERKQTEEEWICRQEQARCLASQLRQIAEVLERNANFQPSAEDCLAGAPPTQQLPQHQYQGAFGYEGAISTLTDLKNVRQRVYSVWQRESMMLGRSGINRR